MKKSQIVEGTFVVNGHYVLGQAKEAVEELVAPITGAYGFIQNVVMPSEGKISIHRNPETGHMDAKVKRPASFAKRSKVRVSGVRL